MDYGTLSIIVPISVVTIAAVIDTYTRKIPNWLVGPCLIAGLTVRWALEGRGELWDSLAAVSLALLATLPFYFLGGIGLGDCKLLAALGAWVGLYQIIIVLFGTALAGGIIAVIYASRRGLLSQSIQSTTTVLRGWAQQGVRKNAAVSLDNPSAVSIPYGPAIAAGVLFSFLYV
jgi:Flp pilus assembly protein protease CpaA